MAPFHFEDFSGGWNIRDAPSELANNESPDLLNVTLDERGGVVKRLGCESVGTNFVNAASNIFYWRSGDVFILQRAAVIYKTTDFTTYTTIKTYSTNDVAAFCDWNIGAIGLLIAVHPTGKVSTYDGTTWTDVATSPKGNCIAIWQNKVWVSGDPDNRSRVYACIAGHPEQAWNLADDYNDMREKDHAPVTALGGGPGMDIAGRPGLLVFKKNWIGRINDANAAGTTFGQYTTLHNEAGAVSAQAITSSSSGLVCSINERGIWVCDGDSAQLASGKISRLFRAEMLNFAKTDEWCAEQHDDRVIFCVSRQGSDRNNLTLEFHPTQGWIVPHDCAFRSLTLYTKNERQLYGASPKAINPLVDPYGKVFQVFSGWSDDGEEILSHFQTRWFEVQGGYSIRLRRMRVQARGRFMVYTKHDYIDTLDQGQTFKGLSAGGYWGQGDWGEFNWGQAAFETFEDLYSWGVAKAFCVVVREHSSTSAFSPTLLEGTTAQQTGSYALYGVLLDYVRLGYS